MPMMRVAGLPAMIGHEYQVDLSSSTSPMATAREIAIEIMPHFALRVLAGRVCSYGTYAKAIGRDPAKESMVIGQAMHAIGAACVLAGVPVAPLYFVKRADGGWRGVFEADVFERIHVLPHYELLYVTAREYKYTASDFGKVERVLQEVLPRHLRPDQLSPHDIWGIVIHNKNKDSITLLEKAIAKYKMIFDAAKSERDKS